ncbi:hypothetical protein BKH41_09175 [Helicobacter sp. 12S02232-10]|uniref:McrB family protein n=1 Tax=Helicobacter sp. 12S02232-10 TaxID=1476197 RepID=UPI000BD8C06F|nr:AAA family ATPase [Helicobacter sp. 12S02232-10]PAF46472.1 hypothetical protein BKH41_09175 [Helicobacter sp. 12S02232-10]
MKRVLKDYAGTLKEEIPKKFVELGILDKEKSLFLLAQPEKIDFIYKYHKKGGIKELTEWNSPPDRKSWGGGGPSASLNKYKEYLKAKTENSYKQIKSNQELDSSLPLNQILYGPPGTGKTYATIEKALEILGKNFQSRAEAKKIFDKCRKDGQIEFVTFHQSYGYEEFVEGIHPEINEEGNLNYEIRDGIFKEIAKRAMENYKGSLEENKASNQNLNLEELIEAFSDYIRERLDKEEDFFFKDKVKIKDIRRSDTETKSFITGGSVNNQRLTTDILKRDYEDFKAGKIKSPNDVKPTYESKRHRHGNAIYYFALYKKLQEFEKKDFQQPIKTQNESISLKPYILIIDEINRGNISKIFGELITLLEPTKRVGENDALYLSLPYSREKFGVPKNVYIIGTMNTADRSIALMDTALRRRFDFVEMMPDVEKLDKVIENIKLKEMLKTINARIEFLYDREHTIGHTFFIGVESLKDTKNLKNIFQHKIIPLLQEYFYEDYAKIDAVLGGNGMIEKIETKENLFRNLNKDLMIDIEKIIYKIKDFKDGIWDDPATYIKIYQELDFKDNEQE